MPIFVDTLNDEFYDGQTEADERNDGDGLSLREAIGLLNAGLVTGPITFDPSLNIAAQDITLGSLSIQADTEISGDIDGDGVGDVLIRDFSGGTVFNLNTNGVTLTNDLAQISADATGTEAFRPNMIFADAEETAFVNTGTITQQGSETMFGDQSIGIRSVASDFTFTNSENASFVTTGRSVVEALSFGVPEEITNIVVLNEGLMQAADDTVRISNGTVINSGTIRTTGAYDAGGNLEVAGFAADAIAIFGDYDADEYSAGRVYATIVNQADGFLDGARTGIFLSTNGTITNEGTIFAEVTGIATQAGRLNNDTAMPYDISINNSGTITRGGENYGLNAGNDLSDNLYSAIVIYGGPGDISSQLTNSGSILAPDSAIYSRTGLELTNLTSGVISGDSDGTAINPLAFVGAVLEDFEVGAAERMVFSLGPNPDIVSEDGNVTTDGQTNGLQLFSNGETYLILPQNGVPVLQLTNASGSGILARVDIDATIQAGNVVFQTNAAGEFIFPASIDIFSTVGSVTVNNVASGISVVDTATGQPIFNANPDFSFGDVIDNAGTMTGDIITGLGDDDVLNSGTINGELHLGQGDDSFTRAGTGSNGLVFGGDGNDTLTGDTNAAAIIDIFYGEDGDDDLNGGAGNDRLFGGDGADDLNGGRDQDRLDGGAGNDTLFGGTGSDTLIGGAGDDTLDGFTGFDTAVYSGLSTGVTVDLQITTAQDTIGAGMDTLVRVENLFGSGQNDTLTGNSNRNRLEGSLGDDMLFGLGNNDTLLGGDGKDGLWGGTGADRLFGGDGNDNLYGDEGRDRLDGGDGNDRLFGGDDVDRLIGGDGNDLLVGGKGTDFLFGGAGADRFDYNSINESGVGGYSRDVIADFSSAEGDRIDVFGIDANANIAGNQAFTLLDGSFTGTAGEIMIQSLERFGVEIQLISLDVDGDAHADMQIWVLSSELDTADFVL